MANDDKYTPVSVSIGGPASGTLSDRLIAVALAKGDSESSTESKYVRSLAFLEAKRPEAETPDELAALTEALNYISAKLAKVRGHA